MVLVFTLLIYNNNHLHASGMDPENLERGGQKNFWRESNITPYPQHVNILGVIVQYHSKKEVRTKWGDQGPLRPPLNQPMSIFET